MVFEVKYLLDAKLPFGDKAWYTEDSVAGLRVKAWSYKMAVYTRVFFNKVNKTLLRVVVCVTYRRVLNSMIGFTDTLFTQLRTTGNYIVIADLHTLQFTVTHALGFWAFTSRILATDS
jgi:hypothetical protein